MLKIEKWRSKQEINTVCSIPTQCPHGQEEGLLSKKWTGVDRGREGAENWQRCADISYG